MTEFSFGNLDDVAEDNFDPVPPGMYLLRCVDKEMKDTSSGGAMLAAQFEVIDGPMQGRRVFHNFNVVNDNTKAVEIAIREIKSWMIACGLPATGQLTMSKIDELEGRQFMAKVGIEKDKSGQYEDKNKIKRFIPPTVPPATPTAAPVPTAPVAPVAAVAAAAAPAADRKPWE